MALVAVSDSSALIALYQVGLLQRLTPLFDELVIPRAVAREIAPTVGPLLAAERTALISEVSPFMKALVNAGFYIFPRLYQFVLTEAGES